MKQFGDKGKEQKVIDKRVESAQTVASYLIRNVTISGAVPLGGDVCQWRRRFVI